MRSASRTKTATLAASSSSTTAKFVRSKSYTTSEALAVLEKHFSPAVPRAPKGNNLVCKEAKGSWITDVEGKKYLDLQTGIGVSSTGHCHPR